MEELFLLQPSGKTEFLQLLNNKCGRFQSPDSEPLKFLEGITVEQLHDHKGLKLPLQYVDSAMGPTAFRQPQ